MYRENFGKGVRVDSVFEFGVSLQLATMLNAISPSQI